MTNLFDAYRLGDLRLPNRVVMAPMTRVRATADGLATPSMAIYYAQRATAGLIVSEGVQPSLIGQSNPGTPGLHTDEQVAAWRPVTAAVHANGGRIFAQLMHGGRVSHPDTTGMQPVGPSAVPAVGDVFTPTGPRPAPTPRALDTAEVPEHVQSYARAARRAIDAGFDGVELHGANGYLIHQFLADGSNVRNDGYGGSVENRIRFAVEVAQAVSDAIGPERVGIRLSPGNTANGISESDPAGLYRALIRALAPYNLAYVHLMEFGHREVTEAIREEWPGTLILNPHATGEEERVTPEVAVEVLRAGLADAVSLASLWLANPDLPARIKAGGPYNEPDPSTFYGGDHRGYTDYPTLDG